MENDMIDIFLTILNRSISASWIVLAVLLVRLLLRKSPKWINCVLWAVVALRLVLPFSPESMISLIPSPEVIPSDILVTQAPAIHSGIPAVNSVVNPLFTASGLPDRPPLETGMLVVTAVWLTGVAFLLLYSLVTYLRIRLQVRASLLYHNNIYVCDNVGSPFILGTFRPRIYLPSGLEQPHLSHVLAHESAHLKRLDHWWKPLGFLLLTAYWFNPLLWVAYILLCRDIEMACDEKVISGMDSTGKLSYSEALVACSVHRRLIMACPVAFGEVSVKSRIKQVLCYKKPGIWVALAAVTACVFMAGCFLTDPVPCDHAYESRITQEATCTARGVEEHTCAHCQHTYTTYVDMREHRFDRLVVNKAATCTQLGWGTELCSGCGKGRTTTIDIAPHTAGEPFFIQEANCSQTGIKSATCSVCQEVFVAEVLPVNGVHDMRETVTKKPTCTEAGTGTKTCTLCSHTEAVSYNALGHSYKDYLHFEATCYQDGGDQRICTVCGLAVWWNKTPKTDCVFYQYNYEYMKCKWCARFYYVGPKNPLIYDPFKPTQTRQPTFPVIQWDVASSVRPKPGIG